jgi:hypothetical protein
MEKQRQEDGKAIVDQNPVGRGLHLPNGCAIHPGVDQNETRKARLYVYLSIATIPFLII